jgi:pilus assembly protein CpaE
MTTDATEPKNNNNIRLVRSSQVTGYRTRILVVDRDPSAVAMLRSILRAQGWEVISGKTAADALAKARAEVPDAIVLELNLPDMSGIDLCQTLRQQTGTEDTPIIVLSSSAGVTERVACLRAGATDYLVKPADAQDLIARLKAALDMRQEKAGFCIAVVGSKGGVGTSMVATNLAVALRKETHRRVAVVDAAIPVGTVDIMLNLQPGASVGNLMPKLEELERADFEAILTKHVSGIEALLLQDLGADRVRTDDIHRILLAMRRMRDLLIVDTCVLIDEKVAAALELADRVLLVVTPEITSLRGARLFFERARLMGLMRERVLLVLNRSPLRGGLQQRDIENALGQSVLVAIPDDTKLVTYSINRGVPVVESHASSGIGRHITALAKSLVEAAQQQ